MRRTQWAGTIGLVIVVSLAVGNAGLGQVTLDPAWPVNPRTFGGEHSEAAFSAQQTSDGGYIVAGCSGCEFASQAYLIKLDSAGNLDPAWNPNPKTFGGAFYDHAYSVQETTDGGCIVAGSFYHGNPGLYDVYLIKLDSAGNLDRAWDPNPKTFGGEGDDRASSIEETADGGYIVAGETQYVDGSFDVYLLKLDADGDLDPAWDPNPKTFGGEKNQRASSVHQTSDGGYIVAGSSGDAYLIKLDSAGRLDPAWETNPKTFGGEGDDRASSIQETTDGGYIVAGWTESFGAGEADVYLIKLDADGNLDPAWNPNPRTFGGEEEDYAYSVRETQDGGYIVAGCFNCWSLESDVYLIKLDSAGNLDPAWEPNPRTFGGEGWDKAHSVQETRDGGYIVVGSTGPDWNYPDVYLIKLAPSRHFLRGDCDASGGTTGVADALQMLTMNFIGDVEVPCLAACDTNGDGDTSGVRDALELLTKNFIGGVTIPEPHPACGAGQLWTDGPLGCETELECN